LGIDTEPIGLGEESEVWEVQQKAIERVKEKLSGWMVAIENAEHELQS
jgi:hypothetical protein